MFRKTTVVILLSVLFLAVSQTQASEPNDYIIPGRSLLFDGTVSGLRSAYETFDNGLNDSNCVDCNSNRELIFLHAITRIAMWVFRDDGTPVDSAIEFAREFDVNVVGDYWDELDINHPVNQHDAYEIPEDAPDIINEILDFIDTSAIPEISVVIAEFNSISDSPADRFRIFFDPNETRMFFEQGMPGLENDVEVDYGEVLMLKGLLTGLKAMLQSQLAYDVFIDANDLLIEKIYGDCFNINIDLLGPYPDLFKVLPTANDSNDGAAILAQARQDWIDSINYYLDAIDYIRSEDPCGTDPQEDELLYIDPNDEGVLNEINDKLTTLRNSLVNDTAAIYTFETTKKYDIQCSGCNSIGQLELVFDLTGLESKGSLTLEQCAGVPSRWIFEDFSIDGNELYIEMDYEDSGINYNQAQSLNLAKSVLFTPIDCGADPNTYKCELLTESLFSATGTPQGWHGYNQTWSYSLPFAFPFFGTTYTDVNVCTNGFLDFTNSGNDVWDLENRVRIQPFGAYLGTDSPNDIYIEQVDSNEVKFRWDADCSGNQCNFSISLFRNGNIRFDYGLGNNNAWPYIGISNGSSDSCIKLGNSWGGWGSGLLYGTISQDQNSITNATFECWGDISGTLNDLSGQVTNIEVQDVNVDLNPVFGSSVRYPAPVNLRDLLPVFDEWNAPQPNTVGHGLGDDATLGGIAPDMTQYDWQVLLNLQPSGLFYLDFISPWQVTIDGNVSDWSAAQLVFADITGDTVEDSNDVNGVDIENVYMAYDWENVYGAISLNDPVTDSSQERSYTLTLSYSHNNTDILDSLNFEIYTSPSSSYGRLYHMTYDEWGWMGWQNIADLTFALGQDAIEFKVPFADIPTYLPGRFVSAESSGQLNLGWHQKSSEQNLTHLKIGDVGTISGTVSYNGYRGDPIFIQAYTDPEDPEGSIVAGTMILDPGPYTLNGVGLGWRGFVRAFTPLFGFDNPFELVAFDIQTVTPVFLMEIHLGGVDIVLYYPTVLEKDVWEPGEIDADTREVDWYAFDAVQGGTYTLDLTRGTADYACMTLYGRDGDTEIEKLYDWQTQQITGICPVGGRYYVKVANGYYQPEGGTYQICMTSNLTCPQADIACAEWVGVKDCKVDFHDLSALVSHWLDSCSSPYWCDDCDFNESGLVDFTDFANLANEWMVDGNP